MPTTLDLYDVAIPDELINLNRDLNRGDTRFSFGWPFGGTIGGGANTYNFLIPEDGFIQSIWLLGAISTVAQSDTNYLVFQLHHFRNTATLRTNMLSTLNDVNTTKLTGGRPLSNYTPFKFKFNAPEITKVLRGDVMGFSLSINGTSPGTLTSAGLIITLIR